RAQQHGRAQRLQRVLRFDHDRGRWMAADSLQRRQHFGDDAAPAIERFAQRLLALVQRQQAVFGLRDLLLDVAHAGGDFDHLAIELAAVVADRFDLTLETGLVAECLPLFGADGGELLVALLEIVEIGWRTWRLRRRRHRRRGWR